MNLGQSTHYLVAKPWRGGVLEAIYFVLNTVGEAGDVLLVRVPTCFPLSAQVIEDPVRHKIIADSPLVVTVVKVCFVS